MDSSGRVISSDGGPQYDTTCSLALSRSFEERPRLVSFASQQLEFECLHLDDCMNTYRPIASSFLQLN